MYPIIQRGAIFSEVFNLQESLSLTSDPSVLHVEIFAITEAAEFMKYNDNRLEDVIR